VSAARPKLLVVCGPTATGKTALAIRLAETLNGEIINADSMQVYRYMNIGTAKPDAAERQRAAFHVIDVADPDDTFSTGRFKKAADRAAVDILARGRVPIIAGGTGLYIKALVHGLWEGPSADPDLRHRYKAQEKEKPGVLYERLRRVDAVRAAEVHPADFVRIERALEVFDVTGRPLSEFQQEHRFSESLYRVLKIGLHRDRDELAAAVEGRVDRMMEQGWLGEVRDLRRRGYEASLPSQAAIGYKELHQHLDGELTLADALRRTKTSTRKFAKRQRTWFGADDAIRWFDVAECDAAGVAASAFLAEE